MRILHVITDLNTGGAEKLLVDLLPILKERGDVELALFVGTRTPFFDVLERTGIKIHVFANSGSVYNPVSIIKLAKLARLFDIVHTHNTAPQLYGAIASLFCNTKFCTTEHTTTNHHRVWWFKPVERWMYGRYNHVVCISEATYENMKAVAGPNIPEATVISNGIDIESYQRAVPASRGDINTDAKNKVLLMIGRLSYQKDQATIIRAMALLPSDVDLWLVGDGETHDELQKLAMECSVTDRVHFLGTRTDVANLLKACDIVIQSSHIEGFGLAAVEGMAAGKPVIASDVRGLAQVVDGAGILFPHADVGILAREVMHLLSDQFYYDTVSARCVDRACLYDIHRMATEYEKVYERMVAEH